MWWVVLIMVLAFFMVLGPVLMLKPSRRQQQLAQLRLHAAQQGLQVELETVAGKRCAAYQQRWPREEGQRFAGPEWALQKQNFEHDIHFSGLWDWRDQAAPEGTFELLRRALAELPASVIAIEASSVGLRCCWTEVGGAQALESITAWLKRYSTLIWPYMYRRRG